MIEARYTFTGKLVCELYSGRRLRRAFREVRFIGDATDTGLPMLTIANHFSWWDGFIQYRLNKKFFGRRLYIMMLQEQLEKNMLLNKCGCFSVNKQSRDIIRTLDYSASVLQEAGNMLLMFPQGEIQSIYEDYIKFQSGVGYLLKKIRTPYTILFNVNLVDYASEKKPSLNVYFKTVSGSNFHSAEELEKAYNLFYAQCKTKQKDSI